jgi:membrane associated rhomboid family serine protease
MAKVIEQALREAGIPFETGVQAEPAARVVFTVRETDAEAAQAVVAQFFGTGPLAEEEAPAAEPPEPAAAAFPRRAVAAVVSVVLAHLALVALLVGRNPNAGRLASVGGLVSGAPPRELWRLLSSLFLHADPQHALWNGLSMLVFAVPLIERAGWVRTVAVYLAGGLLGGVAALATSEPGTVTIGSSGAVAGLFGYWVVSTIRRARRAPLPRRGVLRSVGIGLLVLPSLLTPTTVGGGKISVAAHLGGLAAGLLCGAAMQRGWRGGRSVSAGGTGPADAPFRGPSSRS